MAKFPRPSVVEKIQAKQAHAGTELNAADLHNVLIAARKGVGGLPGVDLANAAASIARLEHVLEMQNAAQNAVETPKAGPANPPAPAAAAAAAKG